MWPDLAKWVISRVVYFYFCTYVPKNMQNSHYFGLIWKKYLPNSIIRKIIVIYIKIFKVEKLTSFKNGLVWICIYLFMLGYEDNSLLRDTACLLGWSDAIKKNMIGSYIKTEMYYCNVIFNNIDWLHDIFPKYEISIVIGVKS